MANTSSAKKAVRAAARRTRVNQARSSRVKSRVRAVEEAIAKGDRPAAELALRAAQPELMRAANRNVIHRNKASRKISRLARRVKAVTA